MMNIVILAAGKGKRMHSDLPKVLHPIAGQPMVFHLLRSVAQLTPQKVCVVIGHGGQQVKAAIEQQFSEHFIRERLQFVVQDEQLGTGHAVRLAAPFLDDSVPSMVLYGDVPLTSPSTLLSLSQASQNQKLALVTIHLPNPTGYGRILRTNDDHIVGVVEEKDALPEQRAIQEVNTGLVCAPTTHLKRWLSQLQNNNNQGEYYLTDIVGMAYADHVGITSIAPMHAYETEGVNSKSQLAALERAYQQQLAHALLEKGVTLLDYTQLNIRGQLQCGRDVTIDTGCVILGDVTLGDRVHIGPYCVLENCHIDNDTQIHAFSHLSNAKVGAHNIIGPYARLRPGTHTQAHAQVGNFVELKNTTLGSYSKTNHLAYVGDAIVGEHVNIGAGTITCNYDGVNKHQTIIEDHAFIGSDTQLVAPVTVGKGATIGAGTTLTSDAPPNQLTISRVRQQTINHWQRPTKKL